VLWVGLGCFQDWYDVGAGDGCARDVVVVGFLGEQLGDRGSGQRPGRGRLVCRRRVVEAQHLELLGRV
jgi:hypothetical protein